MRVDHHGRGHNIGYKRGSDKQEFFKNRCQPGTYYLTITPNWTNVANQCTFTIYGPKAETDVTVLTPVIFSKKKPNLRSMMKNSSPIFISIYSGSELTTLPYPTPNSAIPRCA